MPAQFVVVTPTCAPYPPPPGGVLPGGRAEHTIAARTDEKVDATDTPRVIIGAVTPRSSSSGLLLALVFGLAACGGSDGNSQLVVPGADSGTSPDVTAAPAPTGGDPTESVPAPADPVSTDDAPVDTVAADTTAAPSGGDGGPLGFVEVDGNRYGLEESAFCYIGASGSTGSFLGRDAEGRTGVLSLDIDPEYGPGVNFHLDVPSLDLGAEGPETSPQYEARSQTVMEIGTLDATVDGDTVSGSGTAADLNSASMFEANHSLSFSARCP